MKKIKPKPKPITTTKQAHTLRIGINAGRLLARDVITEGWLLRYMDKPPVMGRFGQALVTSYNKAIYNELYRGTSDVR